jgi:xanthine dehydrogenase accessory factor
MTIDAALREIASGSGPVALVTVARVSGSAPRHAGSRMAVRPDGGTAGTVGGGKPEARAIEAALACLASGHSLTLTIEMTGAEATGVDLICGGTAEMWIEVVADRSLYAAAVAAVDSGEAVVVVASAEEGCLAVVGPRDDAATFDAAALERARESRACSLSEVDGRLYSPLESSERLLILGGGHVGLALARVAVDLAFHITLVDPRKEYSEKRRFPSDVACINSGFAEAIEGFAFGPSTYVVVVSPGHLGDLECARAILDKEYRYAGFIGSRRKSRMLKDELITEGFTPEKVESLHAPIGLSIGAETPEEIAIAIAAELIAHRHSA